MKVKPIVIISNIFISLAVLIAGLYIFHNVYFSPVVVEGSSMYPTLKNNDYGIMDTSKGRLNKIRRFDIVIIHRLNDYIIKRVIGMPNEKLQYDFNGNLFINNEIVEEPFLSPEQKSHTYRYEYYGSGSPVLLDENQYFVLGDNRGASSDSRAYGPYLFENITGVLFAIEGVCVENGDTCSQINYHFPEFF